MHEVYSYSGYDRARVDRALASAARELRAGRPPARSATASAPTRADVLLDLLDAPTARAVRALRARVQARPGRGLHAGRAARGRRRHGATERTPGQRVPVQEGLRQELGHRSARRVRRLHRRRMARGADAQLFSRSCTITTYVNEWIRQNRYRGHVKVTELNGTVASGPRPTRSLSGKGDERRAA